MKSIKFKLVIGFNTMLFAMLIGLGAVFMYTIIADITEDTNQNLMDMAQQEAQYIEARINERLTYIDSLARNSVLLDKEIAFEDKIAFFEKEAKETGYLAFAFADNKGNSTVFNSNRETTNIANRDYFQTAMKGEKAVSDLIISSATGELVLIFAAPVYAQDEIAGVIYGRRDGNTLSEIVSGVDYKQTGYAYMVNNQGVTVGHKNTSLVMAQDNDIENAKTDSSLKELGELTQQMITREVGSGNYTYNGIKKIVGFAPVPNSHWVVAYGLEEAEALADVRALGKMLWVFVIAAGLVGAVITYIISAGIANPIRKVTLAAQEIAEGKFDVNLDIKSKDEVGQLAEAFNMTLQRLTNYQNYIDEISDALLLIAQGNLQADLKLEYVGLFQKLKDNIENLTDDLSLTFLQINQASDQVASGSDQVAAGAQTLSQGAIEQASSIEELTAAITAVSEDLKRGEVNAQEARRLSGETGVVLGESNKQMQELMVAMIEITDTSHEIGKIIKNIDDIAFQTNILALNAAVEAARAGVAGKGFAVVADEVRNLAAKSAEAAKDTTELIQNTLNAIETGTKLADGTASSLKEVVDKAGVVDQKVQEIAVGIEEEARAAVQIAAGIEEISAVVQNNSATAEESAATSEELSGQAQMLKEQLSKFKLSDNINKTM